MSQETPRSRLKELLQEQYGELKTRLGRLIRSEEVAADALQDTWLRVDTMNDPGMITNPAAYLFRMAFNIAQDRYRSQSVRASDADIEDVMRHAHDETADPARIIEAQDQIRALEDAMRGLTPRRRAILIAVRVEGTMIKTIAERYGVSVSLVEKDLRMAIAHCRDRLERMPPPVRSPEER